MTLDYIEVFKTIVEQGSFRKAAEKLNRAQSAVSYAIKKLEEELLFALFDRSQYRSKLTPQGEAFYKRLDSIFQAIWDLESFAKGLRQGCEPQLRLAISPLLPLKPIIQGLEQLRWKFPQTELKLSIDILGADRLITQGLIDLAVSDVKGHPSKIESILLGKIQLIAVTGISNPAIQGKKNIQVSDLKNSPQIILKSSEAAPERSAAVLNKDYSWIVSDFLSKKELLISGLGWGYMPVHLVKDEVKNGSLIQIFKETQVANIYLLHLKSKPKGPSTQFLWDFFKQIIF